MNLHNTSSRDSVVRLGRDVESLRGGFGNGSDSVGSSYHKFYLDSYDTTTGISGQVERARACCDSVRPIDPDKLCRQGFSLINTVKNYPKV